ncbi:LysR family transcriptional regulator [Acidomonas methanolica]|uniref:Transcriptional regulator LysR n=1 Tax=Acidomonas methanolica NBRC 104435 TaxID=1231351 RepID=A0A023D5T5_ACIMT|nr:LysR family transcriptional regulator [Acidomonas methanolica]MBU2653089.1 LysR family transcriptional regulator [Acidomonas methanolica]TCS27206.1 DNA-binding transcriptional LysR family regulator [Acidomonas methanolica]GAJ29115.1 transcriptional regulator LysR [Acidomonas methanolica NBRC 104435]GBQ47006.1 LysR family transcriptional regulator [Acidomonas methanolica]GEK99959.1 LysR family transcriptional regulator [Acidomonas methanolica NBRC 104435]
MSLLHLRTFVEVHRCRSISEAARALSLTQPAVSQHIASLEAQLGRALFVRHTRGVRPTAAADDLAMTIGDSLDRAETALAAAKARSADLTGTLHLAAPAEYLGEYVAPRLAPLIEAGLDLRLHIGGRDALYDWLLSDTVDLGLTASLPEDPRLNWAQLGIETLQAVAIPDITDRIHHLGLKDGLRVVPHIAYDLERPLLRTWLSANDLAVDRPPVATAPDMRVLRAMLMAGIGWSVLPDYLTREQRQAGTLREIAAPKAVPRNAFHLVWARTALRHPRVAFAREALLAVLSE